MPLAAPSPFFAFFQPLLLVAWLTGSAAGAPPGASAGEVAGRAPTVPVPHVPGALAWDKTRIELQARPGETRAEVAFTFRNTGAKPVTITSVQSSCGCTTTHLKKNTYAPDETGEVRAVFEFGDRNGPQQKVVTVTTDDAVVATQLVLRVDIPESLVLDQRIVQWRRGEPAEAKNVSLRTAAGVTVEGLDFDPKQVEASLEALPSGWRTTAATSRRCGASMR